MPRPSLIFIAVSLGFFFVTATTFTSLGYVLYTMVAELGWSRAAAGLSFSLLGLACGLSSPLPPAMMKWLGTRATMTAGALVLALGFGLAAAAHGIGWFFLATSMMGVGYSLVAPSPAVFLLATWFPERSARMIGLYFMAGAFGGVVGPLIVSLVVTASGSWRLHWTIMAAASTMLALVLAVCIRDAVRVESVEQVRHAGQAEPTTTASSGWTVREAMASGTFFLLAAALMVVQTVVTTMHSALVAHVATLGAGSGPGALAMSLLALAGTAAKGVTGALSERVDPKKLLVVGLAVQCAAVTLLCATATPAWAYVFALLFGLGWGLSWLSAHILLLRYFGAAIAGDMVAMATMATTIAVIGPLSAGWVADRTGGFVPVFLIMAALLGIAALGMALFLRAPRSRIASGIDGTPAPAPDLVAAE